jgi:hypothetical protein
MKSWPVPHLCLSACALLLLLSCCCRFVGNKADEDGAAVHSSQWGMVPARLEIHCSHFEGNEVWLPLV